MQAITNAFRAHDTLHPVAGDRKFRWGIIGASRISQDFAHALRDCVPDAILQAVGARELSRAEDFAKNHQVAKAYGSFEEVAADPLVEIVYVGTLHNHHFEHAMLAIKHGKHVLVEKAFTQNAAQAQQLVDAAKAENVFLMEAYWARFMPWAAKLRELIAQGTLGDVQHVICDFTIQFDRSNQRIFDPALCGGSLLDVGIYPIGITSMIYGDQLPEKIVAIGDLTDTGVDGHVATTLRYGPNKTAQLFCGVNVDGARQLQVFGTKGRVFVHDKAANFWHCSTSLVLSLKQADGSFKDTEFTFPKPQFKDGMNHTNSEMLAYEAVEVERCVAQGLTESPLMTHQTSVIVMKTLDECRRQVGVVYPEEK